MSPLWLLAPHLESEMNYENILREQITISMQIIIELKGLPGKLVLLGFNHYCKWKMVEGPFSY